MKNSLKYLSFQGRDNRQRYWLTALALVGLLIANAIVGIVLGIVPILSLLVIPVWLALAVAVFANATRRLHDRNKSAWWLLLFCAVPAVLNIPLQIAQNGGSEGSQGLAALLALVGLPFSIWGLVEMGFLKGTTGTNRFGDDPLAAAPLDPAIA